MTQVTSIETSGCKILILNISSRGTQRKHRDMLTYINMSRKFNI